MKADYEGHVDYPPLQAGEAVAPGYEIVEHLHQSNNFDVYDVFSEERACRCIAKIPRQDLIESVKVRRGLLREGRLLKKLTHPHIVRSYETLKEPQPTLILEMLTGETLSYIIDTNYRRMPISEVIQLGLHLCSAIHYLHGHGILHLDLKSSNIVSERGMAKILDLSIASKPGRGKKGAGTRQYMAPEQVRGAGVSPATDVWGIGAVLFEAATDVAPFNDKESEPESYTGSDEYLEYESESESGSETDTDLDPKDYEQLHRRADSVRVHRRVPAAFANAMDGCLNPDPSLRPTVDELSRDLAALV
ncbi:MAG: serine/threonine protein kinase [Actinomycetota bacterium]|nr:serine/threonine protein kinase [Actinomycetota bacterium]